MKYLPSAKSPFWQMLFAAHAFAFAYLLATGGVDHTSAFDSNSLTIPVGIPILVITFTFSAILAYVATRAYNKAHPKSRLSIFQVMPPELNDDDERLTSLTAKATRNVYLFHNTALPILAVLLIFLQPSLPVVIILTGALTMGHYVAYWVGIKPALQD
jgi:hypothetical protein